MDFKEFALVTTSLLFLIIPAFCWLVPIGRDKIIILSAMLSLFVSGIVVFKILDVRDSESYAYTIRSDTLGTHYTNEYTLNEDTLEFTDESGTKRIIQSCSFEITENKKNAKKTEEE